MRRLSYVLIALVVVALLAYSSVFIVNAREQALVLRFGEITRVIQKPGIYFKLPTRLVDTVQIVDSRLLSFDLEDIRVQVRDGRRYIVDAFVAFKVTDPQSGHLMGFRADITPQVARIDAHTLRREGPNRLCYAGSVLHAKPRALSTSRSPIQLGAELYGDASPASDVEVISLMLEMLELAAVPDVHMDLGHVGIYRGLARAAGLSGETERSLFDAALDNLTRARVLPASWRLSDPAAYYEAITGVPFRSPVSRYRRLSDDLVADGRLIPAFAETAARVVRADLTRLQSLPFITTLDDRDVRSAAMRVAENRCLIAWVRLETGARSASYRYALEHLLVAAPEEEAIATERSLAFLDSRRHLLDPLLPPDAEARCGLVPPEPGPAVLVRKG